MSWQNGYISDESIYNIFNSVLPVWVIRVSTIFAISFLPGCLIHVIWLYYQLKWGSPDEEELVKFMCEGKGFKYVSKTAHHNKCNMSEVNEGPTCINREVEDCAISLNRADLSFVTNCSAQEMRMVLSYTRFQYGNICFRHEVNGELGVWYICTLTNVCPQWRQN